MTLSEQIDEILIYVAEGGYIGISNDTPDLYRKAVSKMKALGLIVPRANTYDLTDKGYDAIEVGGYEKWRELIAKREAELKNPLVKIDNSIFGNNNSGNNVGQDFEVFPQIQPETSPSQNAKPIATHEVKMSTAQFVFWLFSALVSGIGIGFAIAKTLS
ncbi:hypothetical protein [Spirosoma fluviale]|uniref:Uncharacterized protein n=1 Tax=Spirosoma fluviale TaxID=1597977 RepID=A0A286GQ48_9BACT|nr:hypothetical protein [Spirosoma fluviale]SOD97640.1 hypothetical protein SAMN06269250_5867 [Spirosoma fluviale]